MASGSTAGLTDLLGPTPRMLHSSELRPRLTICAAEFCGYILVPVAASEKIRSTPNDVLATYCYAPTSGSPHFAHFTSVASTSAPQFGHLIGF